MTSNFPEGKTVFLDHDGLSSLVRALQGKISKLRIKSSSMLRSMISESLIYEDSTVTGTGDRATIKKSMSLEIIDFINMWDIFFFCVLIYADAKMKKRSRHNN